MGVQLEGRFGLPVSANSYSPAESASPESKDKFYHDLRPHEFLRYLSLSDCNPESMALVAHLLANNFVAPQSEHCINIKLMINKKGFSGRL